MSRWFRWYAGTTEDGKFRMVARVTGVTVATVTGVWAALLEDASHPDHRGVVTKNEDYFAAVLDLEDAVMESVLAAMQDAGMLSIGHGAMTVVHWKERQYETDTRDATNAERQRRHRAKRKENDPQTGGNGSNALLKRPDPDSESDTESITQSTEQEPAIVDEGEVKKLIGLGLGSERHVEITPKAKRAVCQDLNIEDAEPLVRVFENWAVGKTAKTSRSAWFRSAAPTLWKNNPHVHAACRPASGLDPPTEPVKVAKPSSSLAKSKLVTRDRNAH